MSRLPTEFPTQYATRVSACFERGLPETREDWEAIWFVMGWLLRGSPPWTMRKSCAPPLTFDEAAQALRQRLQGDAEGTPVLTDLHALFVALLRLETRYLAQIGAGQKPDDPAERQFWENA